MTSAPSAPCTRSRHMKPKRSWPGVPNRYSLTSSSIVMQPKSRATVVVVLSGVRWFWSNSEPAVVIAASVRSGVISEMAPTAVVFPTPKPPAIMILTGVGARCRPPGSTDWFESTNDPFDHAEILAERRYRASDDDVAECREIGHENPCHPDVQPKQRGDLRDGHRGPAQLDDVPVLEGEA